MFENKIPSLGDVQKNLIYGVVSSSIWYKCLKFFSILSITSVCFGISFCLWSFGGFGILCSKHGSGSLKK